MLIYLIMAMEDYGKGASTGKRWGRPAPGQCGASPGAGRPAHLRIGLRAHSRGRSIVRTWPHSRGIGMLIGLGLSGLGNAGLSILALLWMRQQ